MSFHGWSKGREADPHARRPGPGIRAPLIGIGSATVAVAAVLALLATGVLGPRPSHPAGGAAGRPTSSTAPPTPLRSLTADQAGRAFLTGFVDPDGRVVRRDQGDDTVSEGQAYAMLVSVGLGDRGTFGRVWQWTRTHLMRADGLLSWRWQSGHVLDAESASDADLDAARALILAGHRFGDQDLTVAGTRLGTAILDHETARTRLGLILTAGSWARQDPYGYNPSYVSPVAFDLLGRTSRDVRWAQLAAGSRAATRAVLAKSDLPPDWAQIHADGTVDAMPGAAGRGNDGVRYSYDAARLPIRYAESCSPADVAVAARLDGSLSRFAGTPAVRDLGGRPLSSQSSAVGAVGQAAAAASTGDSAGAAAMLITADHLEEQNPTYYGAAWDALGRLMLQQNVLGNCVRLSQ